jgi:hypothetical protein
MKKSAKSSGKKPAAKKSSKRTITVESDVMPVEEVPEMQVQETEATPAEPTVAEEPSPMEATPPEVTVAVEPKPTKAKRGRRAATSAAKAANDYRGSSTTRNPKWTARTSLTPT